MAESKIELRKLCAKDLFPMMKIVSKIKIREFKNCFDSINAGDGINAEDGLKTPETIIRRIGIEAAFNIADVVLTNIGCCSRANNQKIYRHIGRIRGKHRINQ